MQSPTATTPQGCPLPSFLVGARPLTVPPPGPRCMAPRTLEALPIGPLVGATHFWVPCLQASKPLCFRTLDYSAPSS